MKLMRKNGGFTLVELIVVIAILAILAGIAVPAYSGYITKANEAADNQLLAAVNTAFAAACIQEGVDINTLSGASMHLVGETGAKKIDLDSVSPAEVKAAFAQYYAGNASATFKVFEGLIFDTAKHYFVNSNVDSVTVNFNGYPIQISGSAVQNLANSTFGTAIGSEALLGKVSAVSGIATGLLVDGDGIYTVIEKLIYGNDPDNPSDAYMENLAAQLGVNVVDLNRYFDQAGPEAKNQFLANSLVLSAAQKTEGVDPSFLSQEGGFINGLKTNLNNPDTATDALAQAAMAYGMYTAYANYSKDEAMLKKIDDIEKSGDFAGMVGLMTELESEGFQNYMASDTGKADLQAYQSAMSVINQSASSSPDAATELLMTGFDNENLSGLLFDIMGK